MARDKNWRLEMFAAIDGVVWTRSQRAEGGWSDWESLGSPEGQEATWVAAIQTRERSLRLFTGRSDLFQRWQIPGGGWSRWIPLDNPPRIRLIQAAVALNAKGQLELWFTIQDTMDLYRLKQTLPNGTEWSGERSFA